MCSPCAGLATRTASRVFMPAARELGAHEHISDLDDSPELAQLSDDLSEIKQRLRALPLRDYDLIFTHGPAGE